jgi:hypothetical protein
MDIGLKIFCAAEDSRYALASPWVRGGWEYATDGRIMVRVSSPESDTPQQDARPFPPAHEIFEKHFDAIKCIEPWPAVRYCPHCFGTGEMGCTGESFEDDGFRGSWDGCKHKCPVCNGGLPHGDVEIRQGVPSVVIGEHWLNVVYDAKIKLLSGVRYSPAKSNQPLPFIFDGGQGCVMGLRKD